MSEIILQTIVEKLEHLEVLMKKENTTPKDGGSEETLLYKIEGIERELKVYTSSAKISNESFRQVSLKLDACSNKINHPSQSQITHTHHLHKGVWISIGTAILCTLLFVLLIDSCNKKEALKANDIKYRMLTLNAGKNLSKVLYHLDSLYNANPEGLNKRIIQQEDSLVERARQLRWAGDRKEKQKN